MKNLFNSASCGNPAKFVWQQNNGPGNNPTNIEDIENHIVSDEKIQEVQKKIDTSKTTLVEVRGKIADMDEEIAKINKERDDQKASVPIYRFKTVLEKSQATNAVKKRLQLWTSSQEMVFMSENNIQKSEGESNRDAISAFLIPQEITRLAQIKMEEWRSNIDEIALNKRVNLKTSDGEHYGDLLSAENKINIKYEEQLAILEDLEETQNFLAKNDINDPEYEAMITKARTEMIENQNKEMEALAAQELAEKIQIPFTLEDIGGSPWAMIQSIPKSERKSFAIDNNIIPGYNGTVEENKTLYKYLKENIK